MSAKLGIIINYAWQFDNSIGRLEHIPYNDKIFLAYDEADTELHSLTSCLSVVLLHSHSLECYDTIPICST